MELYLYHSSLRKKVLFEPLNSSQVSLYCCGPTVYNYAHIGNLRTYIFEDFLRRTLEMFDYKVKHVINVTDVGHLTSDADEGEDKLEKGARQKGQTVKEIAERYTIAFKNDCEKLNIKTPSLWPKASDYIKEQIELVQDLEQKGYTYQIDDGIYFDTSKFPRYANFAGLDVENLEAGKRVNLHVGKKNHTDFALWKFSPKDVKRMMEWNSPWGVGFPGWHLECSAMAISLLGEQIDIHCGGIDHLRVHHTNEVAQSECYTGKKFANYWMHGGWLMENKGKMSKSKDEFVRLDSLFAKGYHPLVYRYFCMSSHYRNYLSFNWDNLQAAHQGFIRLKNKTADFCRYAGESPSDGKAAKYDLDFKTAVSDDLNIPKALSILSLLIKDNEVEKKDIGRLILEWDKILGLDLDKPLPEKEAAVLIDADLQKEVLLKIVERKQAKAEKNFSLADQIRNKLLEQGIVLKDLTSGETQWSKN